MTGSRDIQNGQTLSGPASYNFNIPLTTSIWAKSGPLVEHQDHHVQEQKAHEDNLRHELTPNVDTFLDVTEKQQYQSGFCLLGHDTVLQDKWFQWCEQTYFHRLLGYVN
jgi:hypothetical protein